ncbi:MAG: winged helix-turn-helix domain-containing protein [Caldilineaceae bacterium]|nr:winged helix-turn-helix domain-containing protein [Caldilineaceae bacterium]
MPEIRIEPNRRCAYWQGRELLLTPQEYRVLHCLASRAGEVVSKQTLLTVMWSTGNPSEAALAGLNPTAVDLVIFRLRKKLADNPQQPTYLETRRGFGYILHHARVICPEPTAEIAAQGSAAIPAPRQRPAATAGSAVATAASEPWSTLTRREWQIFLLLGDEEATRLTNGALAQSLQMAEGTLKKHLQNIYRKLGVENRSAAALLAMRVRVELFPPAAR